MMTATKVKERSLLGIKELDASEISQLLNRTAYWDNQSEKLTPVLRSHFVANMFFENSTRTRFSFEMAEKRLGVQVLNFTAAPSSVEKGESIYDTVRTLESMGIDAGVVRLKPAGVLQRLAEKVSIPLINAGDGNNEHPTQALLDLYTMRKYFGELKGLKVSIIGDIMHSRVARSNLWALTKMGASVQFCAPANMQAPELAAYAPYVSMEEALKADVVMMLRVQLERHASGIILSAGNTANTLDLLKNALRSWTRGRSSCTRRRSTAMWRSMMQWWRAASHGFSRRWRMEFRYGWQ